MKILIDIMGADRAPIELLSGALRAASALQTPDTRIEIVCNEPMIRKEARESGLDLSGISIRHAPDVISMSDPPLAVVGEKKQSSMAVGLRALAGGEADAFVSSGNTGALITGGTLIVRRIKGIKRAAIGAILPLANPVLLLDAGANLELTPEQMRQLAYLGSHYMSSLYGIELPRIGQINNGAEPTKGRALQIETYRLLSESEELCFVGNIEPKDLPFGACDVLLADGFTGNILLKYSEGIGRFLTDSIKGALLSVLSDAGCRRLLPLLKRFDAAEHGGAPILGLKKPIIKAHGSSDGHAIFNAVRQAVRFVETLRFSATAHDLTSD